MRTFFIAATLLFSVSAVFADAREIPSNSLRMCAADSRIPPGERVPLFTAALARAAHDGVLVEGTLDEFTKMYFVEVDAGKPRLKEICELSDRELEAIAEDASQFAESNMFRAYWNSYRAAL